MADVKLKPCPFCGGRAEMVSLFYGYFVECINENCKANTCAQETPEKAAEIWNNREKEADDVRN